MIFFKQKHFWLMTLIFLAMPGAIYGDKESDEFVKEAKELQIEIDAARKHSDRIAEKQKMLQKKITQRQDVLDKKSTILDNGKDSKNATDNIQKVLDKKLNDLNSVKGIEQAVDTVLTAAGSLLSIAAAVYVSMYIQQKFMSNLAGNQSMQIYYPGQIKFKFDGVAGLAQAKADMQDIISYLKNPKKYQQNGARVPKGVLMNGGPGNGKTLLAKAVAGEVNCAFISINGSSFIQTFVGVGAQRVRDLFAKARNLAWWYGGCIIFIDEIDTLTMQRGNGSNSEQDSTLNALLAEMDGLDVSGYPVIVLGATNRAKSMDEAIKRPGRFDRIVQVSKPYIKDRIELLKIAFRSIKVGSSVDINTCARITGGFSGAELANLVNEAAILATNAGRDAVEMQDIHLAFDNITLGRETMGMEQSDQEKWKTAIHEAGHTLARVVFDKKYAVYKSSITPRSGTLGVMHSVPISESYGATKEDFMNKIIVALSGRLAEQVFDIDLGTGASGDLQTAYSIAYNMIVHYGMSDSFVNVAYDVPYNQRHLLPNDLAVKVDQEIEKIIKKCAAVAKKMLTERKADIEKIAKLMMQKGTVLGEEIYNALNIPAPQGVKFSLA